MMALSIVQGSSQRKVSCNDGIVKHAGVFSKKGKL